MRLTHALLAILALSPTMMCQMQVAYPGPLSPFSNLGSQDNHNTGALCVSGQVVSGGMQLGPIQEIVGPNDLSMTLAWQANLTVPPATESLKIDGCIRAFPESPFTLAYVTRPNPLPCCNFGAWLPTFIQSGLFGLYHLDHSALPVWDGLGFFRTPDHYAMTDETGWFPLKGTIPLHTPEPLALQAMVVDATSPIGLRLTAAFAIAKYI